MLLLLSPAKSLDFETAIDPHKSTSHFFQKETAFLASKLKQLKASELEELMGISGKLAELNHRRFQEFGRDDEKLGRGNMSRHAPGLAPDRALKHTSQEVQQDKFRQALLAFDGDVYVPIAARDFSARELDFAQDHLRILSGLYGLLRPLDLIQPYRLEMGTSFGGAKNSQTKTPLAKLSQEIGAKNLYDFWEDKISNHLDKEAKTLGSKHIVNLASEEYFSAIKRDRISLPIIDIQFKENVKGKLKTIGINAKKARGMMTSFVIKNKLTDAKALKKFSDGSYNFSTELSSQEQWLFVRG